MMKIFSDERLMELGIISGTVSRHSGTGRDAANVAAVLSSLGINPTKVLGLKQVHGTEIIEMLTNKDLAAYQAQPEHIADGWLLGKKDCGVLILTADCVPLYIWDDKGKYISLTHCGWRGIAAGLPAKAAALVKAKAGESAVLNVFIGPHISKCCFEVKDDIVGKFFESSVIKRDGKMFVDLDNEIILQLTAQGVRKEDIKAGCTCSCTCCNKEDFFSYRRDKTKDVLISFAYKL